MATRNFVPRSNGEGGIGTSLKRWLNGYFKNLNVDTTATINDTDITTADITTANITTANITTENTTTANVGTLNMSGAINQTLTTLASASTMAIGAAVANYIIVTGTTAITAFDTIQAGVIRTLRFGGSLTLTYNATTMLLPTASDIITAAGDVATFVSGGSGIWRCMDYQRYDGTALTSSNPIAIINETQPSGTAGGTFTSGAWRTRNLNTVIVNEIGVILSSNQLTILPGIYILDAEIPYAICGLTGARFRNITDSTTIITDSGSANSSQLYVLKNKLLSYFTITEQKVFEIQHYCSVTATTNGFGVAASTGENEVYTKIKIEKVG